MLDGTRLGYSDVAATPIVETMATDDVTMAASVFPGFRCSGSVSNEPSRSTKKTQKSGLPIVPVYRCGAAKKPDKTARTCSTTQAIQLFEATESMR